MDVAELKAFESEVARRFEAGEIRAPVHLSGGNEKQLVQIFRYIDSDDWVFSTWRSHYHALLKGVPPDDVMAQIMAGRSLGLMFPDHRFFSSSIVGGILPIAVGVAAGLKRQGSPHQVYCFVGDMAASIGIFHDSEQYARGHGLPIEFMIEDNGLSCDTPTGETWGTLDDMVMFRYFYKRTWPHFNTGKWVNF